MDAETYKVAAGEHVTAARELYEARRYVLSCYVSGLAVECIFRAYRRRLNPKFDARHDLRRLYETSGFGGMIGDEQAGTLGAALTTVATIWSNDHRFRSETALRRYLKRAGLDRGIRGDFVKESARRVLIAATQLVTLGAQQWTRSSKN